MHIFIICQLPIFVTSYMYLYIFSDSLKIYTIYGEHTIFILSEKFGLCKVRAQW